jgi:UDP-glucose 4-epimerase
VVNLNVWAKFHYGDIHDRASMKQPFEQELLELINHHSAQIDVTKDVPESAFSAVIHLRLTDSAEESCARCK